MSTNYAYRTTLCRLLFFADQSWFAYSSQLTQLSLSVSLLVHTVQMTDDTEAFSNTCTPALATGTNRFQYAIFVKHK